MNKVHEDSDRPLLPYGRWSGLSALLAVELLSLSLRFDVSTVSPQRPWYGLTAHAATISQLGRAIALATLFVVWPRWFRELKENAQSLHRLDGCIPALLGNLTAFATFCALSAPVLEWTGGAGTSDWLLFAAWIASGFSTLLFWALALLPFENWRRLIGQSRLGVVVGTLVGVAAWGAGLLAREQWQPLSRATFWLVHQMLSLVCSDAICRPDEMVVGTPSFAVEIARQCSGYEGMGLMAVLIAVFLWVLRRDLRFPRSLLLVPLGIAVIWLSNALRIVALLILGTMGCEKLAAGAFHSLAGWLLFLAIGLVLMALARRTPYFSSVPRCEATKVCVLDRAYLLPALAIIATAMVTGAFANGFDQYYPARIIAAALIMVAYRRSYAELRLLWSWEAVTIGCGIFAVWIALEPYDPDSMGGRAIRYGLSSLSSVGAAFWLVFRVAGSVVIIPLAEELAFRGYLSRRLISAEFESVPPGRFTAWSFLISSLLFGFLHGRFIAGTLAGMALAAAYRRRGELTDAVVAHGVANALIAAAVLLEGAWSLWT
jgi:exosortase E/protease (VPEID-CTERM system)